MTMMKSAVALLLILMGCNEQSQQSSHVLPEPAPVKTAAQAIEPAPAGSAPLSGERPDIKSRDNTDAPNSKAVALAAEGANAATVRGPSASSEAFTTWLETTGNYSAGQPGQVRVMLEAKAPFHCNEEYPYKFSFGTAPSNVSYPTPVVRDMKIAETTSHMLLPIQPSVKGAATIQGSFAFSVCTKDKCLVEKRDLTLPIQIN